MVWPTSLAVFAWHQSPEHRENQARAEFPDYQQRHAFSRESQMLPQATIAILRAGPGLPIHIHGPVTALALMALKIAGYGDHKRVKEATRLLLDRQLPQGGWNYGNTLVFDQELRPMPLSTGVVLNALKDQTSLATIQRSLTYLQSRVVNLPTPLHWGGVFWDSAPGEPAPNRPKTGFMPA